MPIFWRVVVVGLFLFGLSPGAAQAQSPAEIAFWESVRDSGSVEQLNLYLERYPGGAFAGLAEIRIRDLENQTSSAAANCDAYAAHPDDTGYSGDPAAFATLESNADAAIAACTTAAAGGGARYLFQLGRSYLAAGDEARAIRLYREADGKGHILSRFWLAEWMRQGTRGMTKDSAAAWRLHKDIADNHRDSGIAKSSAFWTGWMHHSTLDGVERSNEAAKHYYDLALELGDPRANYGLGFMHMRSPEFRDGAAAIAYFETSIDKTSFRRIEARKHVSDLLMAEFNDSWKSDLIEQQREKVDRALGHLADRRGKSKDFHRDYLIAVAAAHGRTLAAVLNEENVWTDIGSPAAREALRAWHADLGRMLRDGVVHRSATFPDAFPNRQETESLFAAYADEMKAMEDAAADIGRYRAFVRQNGGFREESKIARRCVEDDLEWESPDWVVSLRNSCPFGVLVRVAYTIRYKSGSTESDEFTVTVRANSRKTTDVYGGGNADTINTSTATCLDEFGEGRVEPGEKENSYRCAGSSEGVNMGHPHVVRRQDAVNDALRALIGES